MPDEVIQRLEGGIYQIWAFAPKLLMAIGILLVGLAIAKFVERGTDLALHRIGFDRWMNEGGVTEALARAGTRLDPSTVLAKLVFWTVTLLVILLAADALGVSAVSILFAQLLNYIPHVITAVIVLVLGILLGEFVKDLVLASAGGLPGGIGLARAAKGAIILLSVFMALEQLDIAQDIVVVFFIAVVGAAALAAALAFGLGGRDVAARITEEWYERSRTPYMSWHTQHPAKPQAGPERQSRAPRDLHEQPAPPSHTSLTDTPDMPPPPIGYGPPGDESNA